MAVLHTYLRIVARRRHGEQLGLIRWSEFEKDGSKCKKETADVREQMSEERGLERRIY